MSLETGRKLGPYEVLAPIGAGGMGEVYRARDGKLGRDVAIKVLPEEFAQDEERLRRFQREAKVLASLNHPNIAAIYGLEQTNGTHYLVLELVPGETLQERIARGPISVEESLDIASKISVALEVAHEQGIVHRDLKPANIKRTEDGDIKVLDFGLAKAFVEETPEADNSMSPTITRDATRMGVILGTAAYMSPEQAKGKRVDKRADIWAFGVVLYEMLTGEKAFAAEDVSETLAYVLTKEPDWTALPADTPAALRQTLELCLTKDVKLRVRDIGDVRLAMEGSFATAAENVPSGIVAHRPAWRSTMLVGVAGLLLGGVIVGSAARRPTPPRPPALTRLSIKLSSPLLTVVGPPLITISPDGRTVVYTGLDGLYVRDLTQLESQPIPNTEGANSPFFSPDGRWIGFQTGDRLSLRKVSLAGGPSIAVAETSVAGASWGPDDTIVFGTGTGALLKVSAEGGEPQPVTSLADGEVGHWRPDVLPTGKAALFTVWSGALETSQIAIVSLETGDRRMLTGGTYPRYVPTGHIVFAREASLWAVPFDIDRLELTGVPSPIVEGVSVGVTTGSAQFAIAHNGTLLYASGNVADGGRTLAWVDRTGREEPLAAEPRLYAYPRISPDGTRIALDVRDQDSDIWIWNIARETLTRLTFDPGQDTYPVWTPDGSKVAFGSGRSPGADLFWKAADGTGVVERLDESDNPRYPQAFTPDGTRLVFRETSLRDDLGVLTLDGSADPLLATQFDELNAEISPDGRWLAYESDASGQYEIYVQPFPNVNEGRWQISTGGGTKPRWSPDGSELFYIDDNFFRVGFIAVPITTEPTFSPGNPTRLFEGTYFRGVGLAVGRPYDITPDGERFLVIKSAGNDEITTELILVQNWFPELERLSPTKN